MMMMTHQVWRHEAGDITSSAKCDGLARHRRDSQTSAASGWSPWQQPCCHDRLPISHLTVPAGRGHHACSTMRKRLHTYAQASADAHFIFSGCVVFTSETLAEKKKKALAETLT